PMLHGPQQAERMMAIAAEGEHRVDGVLEHARAGELALFGDMAHEHRGGASALRDLDELLRAAANLRDGARRRAELRVVRGLNRVDHDELWFVLLDQRDDSAHIALA